METYNSSLGDFAFERGQFHDPCPDPDEFQRAFLRTGLQRNLKAIGTFAYQAVVKGVDRYLPSIPNTVDSVRSALAKDVELAPFKQALQPYVEGL